MHSEKLSDLLNDLIYLILSIDNDFAEEYGLTGSEYKTLRFLGKNPGSSMRQIADYLGVSMPRATYVADSLKSKNLIERKSGEDRRKVLLELTKKGVKIEVNSKEKYSQISKKMVGHMSEKEENQLLELLSKAIVDLHQEEK